MSPSSDRAELGVRIKKVTYTRTHTYRKTHLQTHTYKKAESSALIPLLPSTAFTFPGAFTILTSSHLNAFLYQDAAAPLMTSRDTLDEKGWSNQFGLTNILRAHLYVQLEVGGGQVGEPCFYCVQCPPPLLGL